MSETVLVTGGAGFIGSHITDHLIEHDYEVIVYDNFSQEVHTDMPEYLNPDAEYVVGDVRNREKLRPLVERSDAVVHQAAAVGVGQSAYEVEMFTDVNERGTAVLLDIVAEPEIDLSKLVVASSMTVYGEGAYYCPECDEKRYPGYRGKEQLERREWSVRCPDCGSVTDSVPTTESKPKNPTSVYGITKKNQEELCFNIGDAYDVPTVALRYFGVYGERQSLENPYTGVCSVFCSRVKNDKPPIVFEDGKQERDFIHVSDIARANRLAIESDEASGHAINLGTGTPTTIIDIGEMMIEAFGKEETRSPKINDNCRVGDVRHGYADISKARELLGFEPTVSFADGLDRLVGWSRRQEADDTFDVALEELDQRGAFVAERD